MKAYNQAKDQIVIEEINEKGRTASFFSYGKLAVKLFTRPSSDGNPVHDTIEYDPSVLFFSKTTAKYGKRFVESKCARQDMWSLIKKHNQIQDVSGDLNTLGFDLLSRKLG